MTDVNIAVEMTVDAFQDCQRRFRFRPLSLRVISTPALTRGATAALDADPREPLVSIHAPRAGGDA